MEQENELQEFTREPDVDDLKSDFDRCRISLSYWQDKAEVAREVRRNEWTGKGRYGRKEGPGTFPSLCESWRVWQARQMVRG